MTFGGRQKLDLTYVIAAVKSPMTLEQRKVLDDIRSFWLSHWSQSFAETGAPEDGWQNHFSQQDVVVALRNQGEVIACHLYTFHDLRSPKTVESEYFSYLKSSSINTLVDRNLTDLMSMEYLGVSKNYNRNSEAISLGKLLLTLSTHLGEAMDFDAVFGTPITSSSAPRLTANLDAVTVEEGIAKYGYDLCLQYIPTKPRNISIDETVRARAEELWETREVVNHIARLKEIRKAA